MEKLSIAKLEQVMMLNLLMAIVQLVLTIMLIGILKVHKEENLMTLVLELDQKTAHI